jgi:MurNAc alpha-1-phosphate uridylyltransferase
VARFCASDKLAHLWLAPNPEHNAKGDFGLQLDGDATDDGANIGLALSLPPDSTQPRYTYSTIGLYRSALFAPPWCDIPTGNPQGAKAALAPLLRAAMAQGMVSAELYTGAWTDVGTPQRLAQLNA